MGLEPLLKDPELTDVQELMKQTFFDATGYGGEDLLSYNFDTRIFFTRNGGKYQVNENDIIVHLAGPPPDVSDRYLD